jgi:lactoylglutathione lyase
MKRFHVHVAVDDLAKNIRFYSTVFAQEPTVVKEDYAKWMLEDPRVNFAISQRGSSAGINHLGLQVESDEELSEIHARLEKADGQIVSEEGVSCCYARSNKHWITDPQGIAWETFRSLGAVPLFDGGEPIAHASGAGEASACCAPTEATELPRRIEAKATACCCPAPVRA